MAKLGKSVRIAGESRAQLAVDLKAQYEQGASIRELTRTTDRSYGFIHLVLSEAQVPLRGQGRPLRRRTAPSPTECSVALASSAAPARARRNQGLDEASAQER